MELVHGEETAESWESDCLGDNPGKPALIYLNDTMRNDLGMWKNCDSSQQPMAETALAEEPDGRNTLLAPDLPSLSC